MAWAVDLHEELVPEFKALAEAVQDELLAHIAVLEVFGPQLGRPRVDTLNGSRHKNMKGTAVRCRRWCLALRFAFDPKQTAIVLCGGDKSGVSEQRFYRQLVAKADKRFDAHLASMKQARTKRDASKGKRRS